MTSIIYKKIFEVKILHDYFLATKDNSFFSSAISDEQREALLAQKYNFDLGKVLDIRPTASCVEIIRNHKLRFIKTRFGFFIAQKVKRINIAGAKVYEPKLPLEELAGLSFNIRALNHYFDNFSSIPLKKKITSSYYFTNKDDDNNKTFPALSLPVLPFDSDVDYEMGDLSIFGGQLSEVVDVEGNNWQNVDGAGFVNKEDRLLLPRKFLFQLKQDPLPQTLSASLSKSGSIVKTIDVSVQGNSTVRLDFCNDPVNNCVEEGGYDLAIIDNDNNSLFQKKVLLSDKLYEPSNFGVIEIFPAAGTDFNLLDSDGFLIHRVNADNTKVSHPVFELRIRSRITYWRYKSAEAFSAGDIAAVAPALVPVIGSNDTILVAVNPEMLIEGVNKTLNAIELPNPTPATLKYGTDDKIYSDVYISSINRIL